MPERPGAWIAGTVVKLALRHREGRTNAPGPMPWAELRNPERLLAPASCDPARLASLRELSTRARAALAALPPPYRHIAELQRVAGDSRGEVIAFLRRWRSISHETGRRLLRETHAMLRAIEDGRDLRRQWPTRYDPRRNRWFATPCTVRPALMHRRGRGVGLGP